MKLHHRETFHAHQNSNNFRTFARSIWYTHQMTLHLIPTYHAAQYSHCLRNVLLFALHIAHTVRQCANLIPLRAQRKPISIVRARTHIVPTSPRKDVKIHPPRIIQANIFHSARQIKLSPQPPRATACFPKRPEHLIGQPYTASVPKRNPGHLQPQRISMCCAAYFPGRSKHTAPYTHH